MYMKLRAEASSIKLSLQIKLRKALSNASTNNRKSFMWLLDRKVFVKRKTSKLSNYFLGCISQTYIRKKFR